MQKPFLAAALVFLSLLALPVAAQAITAEEAQEAGEPAPDERSVFDAVPEPEADDIPETGNPATGDDLLPSTPLTAPTTQQPGTVAVDPALPVTPAPPEDKGSTDFNVAILQGLNKVTARAQELEAPIGSVTRFGTIEIVVHKCWKSAPSDRPENAALLEVSEIKQNETPQRIYSGWMFSSTPGISSLEHPFYDITVVECKKSDAKP